MVKVSEWHGWQMWDGGIFSHALQTTFKFCLLVRIFRCFFYTQTENLGCAMLPDCLGFSASRQNRLCAFKVGEGKLL